MTDITFRKIPLGDENIVAEFIKIQQGFFQSKIQNLKSKMVLNLICGHYPM
jgi:hypothetical protein